MDSETSLPDNVRSRAYDVINKAEKVENDWSKSADSKPANFDGISESLGWPQTLDSDELGSGGSFLNGAEFESVGFLKFLFVLFY